MPPHPPPNAQRERPFSGDPPYDGLLSDRIALLTLDEQTLEMKPKVLKTFAGSAPRPYSERVVDWVVDKGSPTSFADVGRDQTLPGDPKEDAAIKSAMAVPINPGGGTIGVLYADSVSVADAFGPDDLALFRALANMIAVALDSHALRRDRGRARDGIDVTKVSR